MLFILFFCVVNGIERGPRPGSNEIFITDDYLDYDITPLLKNLTSTINDDESGRQLIRIIYINNSDRFKSSQRTLSHKMECDKNYSENIILIVTIASLIANLFGFVSFLLYWSQINRSKQIPMQKYHHPSYASESLIVQSATDT
jgi:hypothetical protein